MADNEERRARIVELRDVSEGYMSDAEFREEFETKQIRYLQAIAHQLQALLLQNELVIELLSKEEDTI